MMTDMANKSMQRWFERLDVGGQKMLSATIVFVLACLVSLPSVARSRKSDMSGRISGKNKALSDTLSREARRKYDMFFLEAVVQRQKGNSTAAFDLLRYCVELNPRAAEAYYYLAQYYSSLKDKERALEYFKQAADLNPDNGTYLETLAQAYVANGRYDEAITALEQLTQRNKGRDDMLSMLVQLYLQQGDYDKAISTLGRLEELEGKNERLSFAKSDIYTKKGDKTAAISEMKTLADQYPNDLNYRGMYADMLLMNGENAEALAVLGSILDEEPDNVRAMLSMRVYYKQEGDTAHADSVTMNILMNRNTTSASRIYIMRQEITESEERGGDSLRIMYCFNRMRDGLPQADADMGMLQAAYMNLKKMPRDSIQKVLEWVLNVAPDNAAARLELVSYAWSRGDMSAVVELCRAARQYNPDNMVFYYYQGMAYYRMDDEDNALEAFQNGIDVIDEDSNPEFASDFYAVMGDLLHQRGRDKEAFAAYDSCLQWKPDNIGCLNNYAYYLSLQGQNLEKAERMSYKTIKAEPENPTYLDTYAWILFLEGRYAEARVYIDQAVQHDSKVSAVILEHAGDIHAVCGDTERAVELWMEASEKGMANKLLKKKIKLKKYLKQ